MGAVLTAQMLSSGATLAKGVPLYEAFLSSYSMRRNIRSLMSSETVSELVSALIKTKCWSKREMEIASRRGRTSIENACHRVDSDTGLYV